MKKITPPPVREGTSTFGGGVPCLPLVKTALALSARYNEHGWTDHAVSVFVCACVWQSGLRAW